MRASCHSLVTHDCCSRSWWHTCRCPLQDGVGLAPLVRCCSQGNLWELRHLEAARRASPSLISSKKIVASTSIKSEVRSLAHFFDLDRGGRWPSQWKMHGRPRRRRRRGEGLGDGLRHCHVHRSCPADRDARSCHWGSNDWGSHGSMEAGAGRTHPRRRRRPWPRTEAAERATNDGRGGGDLRRGVVQGAGHRQWSPCATATPLVV
mmetsp:Transcript_2570/g.6155  ORF Transcript_2570/g.6155 Transcript_2570/m.6155 type:complete len:206 (+) Transcript_2570:579-1196(+)